MKCKQCNNEIDETRIGKYASGKFCSNKCAKSYSQSAVDTQSLKKSLCIDCGKEIWIKKNASTKKSKCTGCKNKKICKICGQEIPCKRPDICRKYKIFPNLQKYFGFDTSKIGTIEIYEEFDRVKNMLIEDYWDNELSMVDIKEKYGYTRTLSNLFESLDIKTRDRKDSTYLAWKNNKKETICYNQYKCGWHKTWNGKDVFYRSSYELEYAQQLDEQQIDYDMENLRILYWDSQLLRQRVAIPDFYLPEINTIVEIKSKYTYDKQNMDDKIKAYKEHGYKYKLILERNEILNTGH